MLVRSGGERLGLALLIVSFTGCATLDKDECLNADWRTLGFQDGARGKVVDVIGNYRKDCAKHGVTPDLDAYTAGREEGLLEYCREANGFRVGYRGKVYQGVCPDDLEYAFKIGYRDGREIYELTADVRQTERDLKKKNKSLDELNGALARAETELISDGVTSERRAELLQRTRELAKEIGALETGVAADQAELIRKQSKLEALRKASPYL